jgi:hypothetical protein
MQRLVQKHTRGLAKKGYWVSLLSMRKLCHPILVVFLALFSHVVLAQSPSVPRPAPETGLEGVISVGPIHGGPTRQGVPDSRPLANAEFLVAKESSTVASFQTDDQGRFQIALPPGHYTISRKDWKANLGSYGPFEIDVAVGQMKRVQWSCDTGIR